MSEQREELLKELRPPAFAIAYRMLGSVAEAEDIVQEALLRLHRTLEQGQRISSPRAYMADVFDYGYDEIAALPQAEFALNVGHRVSRVNDERYRFILSG
jgi:hypothetical protein